MFGSLGGAEILLILVLALLIFGPRKLPQIGRSVGRAMGEFRRATHDLRSSLEQEVATEDLRKTRDELREAGEEISNTVSRGGGQGDGAPERSAVKAPAAPPPGDRAGGDDDGNGREP